MKALLAHLNRLDRYAKRLLRRALTQVVQRDGITPEGTTRLRAQLEWLIAACQEPVDSPTPGGV